MRRYFNIRIPYIKILTHFKSALLCVRGSRMFPRGACVCVSVGGGGGLKPLYFTIHRGHTDLSQVAIGPYLKGFRTSISKETYSNLKITREG